MSHGAAQISSLAHPAASDAPLSHPPHRLAYLRGNYNIEAVLVEASAVFGWETPSASHTLYGCAERQSIQSGAQSPLSAAVGGGEAQEGGPDSLHAKASDHPQCDGQKWSTLDPSDQHVLTNKPVATAT